ncbi:hypothetical protein [Algoriphagus boritolerans]|uniref:Uncharacterized protein n=1 Tax=Algoriphagus boritolerans DSM 17298 = JCM 18970 TaxID=1120964 RepID=A0A1H5ZBX6_9BACT|nr:hypothetical protein [Algoriphagus boritolerans]SEG33898.1 hypothetical protein SAMN03080598_03433 [Algoriphagus boritolerans DSM 17298 = JCM 18970]
MALTETFDILSYKGVDKAIQGLFSKFANQDQTGQIVFDFFNEQGRNVDCEILSLYRNKQASIGISALNLSENSRAIFVSDSYASLICFSNQFKARISFDEAGFLIIGAKFDLSLLTQAFKKVSKNAKFNTVFSTSILGRVMDCKVQDLVYDRKCGYYLSDDCVQFKNQKRNKISKESIFTFSLRTYCISQAIIQTVRTFKPKQKGVESFYQLNQLHWKDLN